MRASSLRFKLSAWYAALFTTVFACFGIFIGAAVERFLKNNLRDTLARRSQHIAEDIISHLNDQTARSLAEEIKNRFAPESSGRFIRVNEIAGREPTALYVSGIPKDGAFNPALIPPASAGRNKEETRVESLADGKHLMIHAMPYAANQTKYLVEVGASLAPISATIHHIYFALAIGGPMVILVAIFGAYLLVGRALTPVALLTRSAERITLNNLNESLPVSASGDELETLAIALNKMISRIQVSFDYTRRFMADASHELRTPLTVMRAELETLLRSQASSPEVQDYVASALEEIDRLAMLVEGLLSLSLLDAGNAPADFVPLDLSNLATSVTEQMGLVAEDKLINLRADCVSPVAVLGDRSRLKQVLVNLLDNAIKHTLPGGEVIVRVRISGEKAILEVIDNGVGIPAADLPHVFERFFRVDKARSREMGGAGLGLSIVQSICSAHSGEVEAESKEGQGSCFRISLPLNRKSVPQLLEPPEMIRA